MSNYNQQESSSQSVPNANVQIRSESGDTKQLDMRMGRTPQPGPRDGAKRFSAGERDIPYKRLGWLKLFDDPLAYRVNLDMVIRVDYDLLTAYPKVFRDGKLVSVGGGFDPGALKLMEAIIENPDYGWVQVQPNQGERLGYVNLDLADEVGFGQDQAGVITGAITCGQVTIGFTRDPAQLEVLFSKIGGR